MIEPSISEIFLKHLASNEQEIPSGELVFT